jgi:hypothetical protein
MFMIWASLRRNQGVRLVGRSEDCTEGAGEPEPEPPAHSPFSRKKRARTPGPACDSAGMLAW